MFILTGGEQISPRTFHHKNWYPQLSTEPSLVHELYHELLLSSLLSGKHPTSSINGNLDIKLRSQGYNPKHMVKTIAKMLVFCNGKLEYHHS